MVARVDKEQRWYVRVYFDGIRLVAILPFGLRCIQGVNSRRWTSAQLTLPSVESGFNAPDMHAVDVDAPSASVDVPSVELAGKVPDMPSVETNVSSALPAGGVSVTAPDVEVKGGDASLTVGLAAGALTGVGGIGAAVGLSGDTLSEEVDASMPSASANVPSEMRDASKPSVEVKKPKRGLFGGLSFKKPSSKGNMEVPHEPGDVSVPSVDVPSVEMGGDVPSASVDAPGVKVQGENASLTAGLVAGGLAALGGIGAAIGLSADKPDASGPLPEVSEDVSTPGVSGSMAEVSKDVSVPDVSRSLPGASGDVSMPSVDVETPSASLDVPSVDPAGMSPGMPSVQDCVFNDRPSDDVSVKAQDMNINVDVPSVGGEACLPMASGGVPSISGDASLPSVGDVSVDIGDTVDDIAAKAPGMPSVELENPKKGLVGRIFMSNKGKIEVRTGVYSM